MASLNLKEVFIRIFVNKDLPQIRRFHRTHLSYKNGCRGSGFILLISCTYLLLNVCFANSTRKLEHVSFINPDPGDLIAKGGHKLLNILNKSQIAPLSLKVQKRSVGGPFRVFKYIDENTILNSESKINEEKDTIKNPSKQDKLNKSKSKNVKKEVLNKYVGGGSEDATNSDLPLSASGVTDRSLIRNSFFAPPSSSSQNNENFNDNNTDSYHSSQAIILSSTAKSATWEDFGQSFKNSKNSSTLAKPTSTKFQFQPNSKNPEHFKHDEKQENENGRNATGTENEIDEHNLNASLSEQRSRRSYKTRQGMGNLVLYQNFNPNRMNQLRRHDQIRNVQINRAPLYKSRNGQRFPVGPQQLKIMNPQQQQIMRPQMNPQQMIRPQIVNPQGLQNRNPIQIRQMQIPKNIRKVVQNPQQQNGPQRLNKPGGKFPEPLPSPSSDFYQWNRPPPGTDGTLEGSWNHPMYQRYSKVAKRMQNKMSGYISGSGKSGSNKGTNRKDYKDYRRTDYPIPLPRPVKNCNRNCPNKNRRTRSKSKGGGGGGPGSGPRGPGGHGQGHVRYSYPKSAQNIQDIISHFKSDNNEIFEKMAHPKSSGSRYSTAPVSRGYQQHPGYYSSQNREREERHPSAMDLSGELKNVEYSLMRDIREFAKRPQIIPEHQEEEEHDDPPMRPLRDDLPSHVMPIRDDDPLPGPKFSRGSSNSGDSRDRIDDPHHPNYNHEEGFDEIFDPKPKPVRDMIKQSSRFRQEMQHEREKSSEYRRQNNNRKKQEDFRERDRIRDAHHERDEDNGGGGHRDYYRDRDHRDSNNQGSKQSRYKTPDSAEHSSVNYYRKKSKSRDAPSAASSVEIDHHHHHDLHREHDGPHHSHGYTSKEEHHKEDHDSERERDPPSFQRDRDRNRKFVSSVEIEKRGQNYYKDGNGDTYPKSIRDKIRDISSIELNPKLVKNTVSPFDMKPVILKRPYEPYRIPPQLLPELPPPAQDFRKIQDHEFWNNYASATEKSLYGYNNNNKYRGTPPAPSLLPPLGYVPQLAQQLAGVGGSPEMHDDIVEIVDHHYHLPPNHGLGPIGNSPGQHPQMIGTTDKNLQNAYIQLLQQKMQAESAMLHNNNNGGSPNYPQQIQPKVSSSPSSPQKKTPMRMKIHIYPNDESSPSPVQQNSPPSPPLNPFTNTLYGNSAYSVNSPSVITYPNQNQQNFQQKSLATRGGGYSNGMYQGGRVQNVGASNLNLMNGADGKGTDKNKNVVLHLHVHRRSDMGPVELETEASEHHPSTLKPLTYKEIYDERDGQQHNQNQQHNDEGELVNHEGASGNGETEADKSVSMEVPIHDDKIEDVLHTLLKFRDRGGPERPPSRKKRRRRRRK